MTMQDNKKNNKPKVVILGAGFAGIRCARNLLKHARGETKITLVDQNMYHTFFPSLYELATFHVSGTKEGKRNEFHIAREMSAIHLKNIFDEKHVDLVKGIIENVDFSTQEVFLRGGRILPYDYLVIALGSETFYYGIKNLEMFSYGLKTIDDAMNIRDTIHELFFRKDPQEDIHIVVGGGGFTGTEFAGELMGYARRLARMAKRNESKTHITIVEASSFLLPGAMKRVQVLAKERLKKLHVRILFNTRIEDVEKDCVIVSGGKKIPHDILVWTAGIKASSTLSHLTGVDFKEKSCLAVNTKLQLPYENVFAAGDNSYCIDPATGTALPLTAPAAISHGEYAARNILHLARGEDLEDFTFSFPGFSVPIGGKWAIAQYKGFVICGFLGWFGKELVMLQYFLSILPFPKALFHWLRAMVFYMRND